MEENKRIKKKVAEKKWMQVKITPGLGNRLDELSVSKNANLAEL